MNKPIWAEIAEGEFGVTEIAGKENNPRIVEYHDTCTLHAKDDETSWCSAFVNWVFTKAGIDGTNSAAARSWLDWGEKADNPDEWCVVICKRGNDPKFGHVGFYRREDIKDPSRIIIYGGNQGDKVCEASFPKSSVLGYRKPKGY